MVKMVKNIFSCLDNLSFKYKTIILVLIIAGGMISTVLLSQFSTFVIKENFDILFDKRTKSLMKLENIKNIYKVEIKNTLKDFEHNQIGFQKVTQALNASHLHVKKDWIRYNEEILLKNSDYFLSYYINKIFNIQKKIQNRQQTHNKLRDDLQKQINLTQKYIDLFSKNKDKQILTKIILQTDKISSKISNLIKYDLTITIEEKNDIQMVFQYIMFFSIISIILIFILSIFLSIYIINNFRKLHNSLEQKVEEKTKELTELNNYLRIKISKEVAQNRKKDLIMFQQARLASLGEMLNNIAHQWRQPLGSITMIIQSFQTKMQHGKLTDEFVDNKVKDALLLANNMSQTLEDFKNFFSPNKTKSTFLVSSCIEHSIELSKYLLDKENIKIIIDIKDNVQLNTYYNELSHVVLNLISNSKDALKTQKNDKIIQITASKNQKNAIIEVLDNGGGIEEDIIPKIFEPYYTTKYKSAGTGIGLYMSKQMVEKHMNGIILYKKILHVINNKPQKCSLFTMQIPLKGDDDE